MDLWVRRRSTNAFKTEFDGELIQEVDNYAGGMD